MLIFLEGKTLLSYEDSEFTVDTQKGNTRRYQAHFSMIYIMTLAIYMLILLRVTTNNIMYMYFAETFCVAHQSKDVILQTSRAVVPLFCIA